ncbi:MAG: hypothetical protein AB7H81_23675 [Vicinamibacterales bacterium]
MSEQSQKNPKLWREMQEPHENGPAVNAALEGFFKALGAAREEHRLADVLVVARVLYLNEAGEEVEALALQTYGDALRSESMAAYAYGQFAARRQEHIGELLTGKGITGPRRGK